MGAGEVRCDVPGEAGDDAADWLVVMRRFDEEGLFAERDALRAEVEHWKGKFTQESKPDPLAHALKVASIVGSVTPCSCNAQRQRAERAEAILAKVRGVAKLNAIAYHAMWNGDVERVFLDILAILDGDDAQ